MLVIRVTWSISWGPKGCNILLLWQNKIFIASFVLTDEMLVLAIKVKFITRNCQFCFCCDIILNDILLLLILFASIVLICKSFWIKACVCVSMCSMVWWKIVKQKLTLKINLSWYLELQEWRHIFFSCYLYVKFFFYIFAMLHHRTVQFLCQLHTYIYIYICIYMCVCVCVYI